MNYSIFINLEKESHLVGTIDVIENYASQKYIFIYADTWIQNGFALEPKLGLSTSPFMLDDLPLFLLDASPDGWGRKIMDRNSPSKELKDMDYVLGVDDLMRMGSIRISDSSVGDSFISPTRGIPKILDLAVLENACSRVERLSETEADLVALLGPGTSMGGARPKAMIRDGDNLYMAKFKSSSDFYRVACWEAVVLKLSKMSGMETNDFKVVGKELPNPILLVKRFDRNKEQRIHFASALTLGHYRNIENTSYAEIGSIIQSISASPEKDVYQWWMRMVFNGMIGNTDDHLRNHGFLRFPEGWRLSPAYDINPVPFPYKARSHVLSFMPNDNHKASLESFNEVGKYFKISKDKMDMGYQKIGVALKQWKNIAKDYGLTETEIKYFEKVFEHEDSQKLMSMVLPKSARTPLAKNSL